jgi:hypothetical protein
VTRRPGAPVARARPAAPRVKRVQSAPATAYPKSKFASAHGAPDGPGSLALPFTGV